MNSIFKYNRWLIGAALLAVTPAFCACDDDDDTVEIVTPSEFSLELQAINIVWNETEAVVDFGADQKWKAEPMADWIALDPTKGTAGIQRMFLNFESNPYRLPRKGQVKIVCGEQTGMVTVTQAGCPVEGAVASTEFAMEVPSLDYATTEVSFGPFEKDILGNLGMTMAEFADGVGDNGDLDFFMVAPDGRWLEAGTAGTRCSAWLDRDLNVTNWDGAGYPAIATFIEVYGGDDATLVVGRAPGVPDDMEYELNFGFTLRSDHSRYIIFKVNVKFPATTLGGNILETIPLTLNRPANDGYEAVMLPFDAGYVCSVLGAASIDLCKVVSYDSANEFIPYTANNGYWFDTRGEVCTWGDGAGWFIEYWGEDPDDPAAASSWAVGCFPGVRNVSGTSHMGFWYNQNIVMFDINVTIGELPEGEDTPEE